MRVWRTALVMLVLSSVGAVSATVCAEDVPADIKLHQRGHGWVLSNAQGMTLYTFTRDVVPGKSACLMQCAQQWPPALASADAEGVDAASAGDWSIIKRPDGNLQW